MDRVDDGATHRAASRICIHVSEDFFLDRLAVAENHPPRVEIKTLATSLFTWAREAKVGQGAALAFLQTFAPESAGIDLKAFVLFSVKEGSLPRYDSRWFSSERDLKRGQSFRTVDALFGQARGNR